MASSLKIRKFESLNMFIHERLTTVAVEIFEVFKDALAEFQEEIYRSKQENDFLKSKLAEVSFSRADAQINQDEFLLGEHYSNQDLLDSSEIQVKLELSTGRQAPEERQLLCAPSSSSSVHAATVQEPPHDLSDAPISQDEFLLEEHKFNQDALDSSEKQVKLEFSSEQQQLCGMPATNSVHSTCSATPREPLHDLSGKITDCEETEDDGVYIDPDGRVKLEPCDLQVTDELDLSARSARHVGDLEKAYICGFCGSSFSTHDLLQNHMKTHTEEKQYHCKFCNKTFRRKNSVRNHEKIHTGEKPYSCSVCGKCFIWINQVKLHIQNHHPEQTSTVIRKSTKNGIMNIVHQTEEDSKSKNNCELCGKTFSNQHVLRKHYRVHTGERPFQCKFCNKSFMQNWVMKEHERIHTGEEKYICSECGLGFSWLRQVKGHIQKHDQQATIIRK